jgi:hypothetical protein
LAGVARGTETREGQSGWVTVKWLAPEAGAFCGMAPVGMTGGWIAFNYLRASCACAGARIGVRTARHELGHAFGYWHTDSNRDLMWSHHACADMMPSEREVYHARVAYESPIGRTDGYRALTLSSPSSTTGVILD